MTNHHRRLWAACTLVGLLALSTRLWIVFSAKDFSATFQNESARLGRSLARTNDFANPYVLETSYSAHCAPVQPLLLAAIYRVFGFGENGQRAKQIWNSVLAALAVALVPLTAVAAGLPIASGLAGGLLAALPTGFADIATDWEWPWVQVLLAVLLVCHLHLRERSAGAGAIIGLGLLWGFALHVNPSTLLLLLLFAAMDFIERRHRQAVLVVTIAAVTVIPWTIRNHQRLGGWIFLRSNFGLELYITSGDDAGPTWSTNLERHLKHHPNSSETAALQVRERGEIAYFRSLGQEAIAWIQSHPWQYLRFCALRFLYLLFPNDLEGRRYQYPVWLITILCLPGFVWMARSGHGRTAFILFAIISLSSGIYIFIGATNWRYRLPAYPMTALIAGDCLWRVWRSLHSSHRAVSTTLE